MKIEAREEFRNRRRRCDQRLLRRGHRRARQQQAHDHESGGRLDAGGRTLEDARRAGVGMRRPAGLRTRLGL